MNPFDSQSYSVPRRPFVCCHPSCRLPVPVAGALCDLHGTPHRPAAASDDE